MKMNSGWDRGHSSSTTFTDKDCKVKEKDRKSIHFYPVYFTSHKKPSPVVHLKQVETRNLPLVIKSKQYVKYMSK